LYFDMLTLQFKNSTGSIITVPALPTACTPINITYANDTSWILDINFKNNLPRILYLVYTNGREDNLYKEGAIEFSSELLSHLPQCEITHALKMVLLLERDRLKKYLPKPLERAA